MTLIEHSREPLRPVVETAEALESCLAALTAGEGPIAFDAERAHGYRYWPKAYLFQIRRAGAGTWLLDPIALAKITPDLSSLVEACGKSTWLIHAASQDLPCMQELQIIPEHIFDTELAARLLGKPAAGLGALLEAELGITLRKAHSADNWSKRPLPPSWLTYAALDVDYLAELADSLIEELVQTQRFEWAEQENAETLQRFAAPRVAKTDPWRRLSGITNLRTPRQFAIARALWLTREGIAQRRDKPPSWILHDSAILEAATSGKERVPNRADLLRIKAFSSPPGQRYLGDWVAALDAVRETPESEYPPRRPKVEGIAHPRAWDRINPEAARRWDKVKPAVTELACDLGGLQASLIAPPQVLQEALFSEIPVDEQRLLSLGARPWQAEFLVPLIATALND